MCFRRAAAPGAHRHPLAIGRMAPDGALDVPRVVARHAPNQRVVDALDAVVLELRRERHVGRVVLGGHQHTGGSAIEPVHDAGTQHAADAGQVGTVVEQRVHQRTARVSGRRVDHQAGRLVDDDQVRVLVQDDERDRFGSRGERRGFGRIDGDLRSRGDPLRRAGAAAIDRDAPRFDPALRLRARNAGEPSERLVEPLPGQTLVHREVQQRLRFSAGRAGARAAWRGDALRNAARSCARRRSRRARESAHRRRRSRARRRPPGGRRSDPARGSADRRD